MTEAMLADLDEAVFLFTFPPILSAFKIHGEGEGMRVQLEIPESEMGEAIKQLAWRGIVCEARIRPKPSKG